MTETGEMGINLDNAHASLHHLAILRGVTHMVFNSPLAYYPMTRDQK